jgi:CBS-domain-containing membrane protein
MSTGPRHSWLFRQLRWLTRWQLTTWLGDAGRHHLFVALFAILAGSVALGTITMAAVLTDLPLLFPPLAPSAFILFTTPLAVTASPRNVIGAHTLAVLAGLFALRLMNLILPGAGLEDPTVMNWARVGTIAVAMALITGLMAAWHCLHPPAAASAMLGAMGYLSEPARAAGLLGAAILLVLEAILLNRALGGMPYPLWRADPRRVRHYGKLAGLSRPREGKWEDVAEKIMQRR